MPATGVAAMLILAAYLLGSLSGSLLLGKLRGVDIRTQGSGNAGGTNAFRTQGAMFALGAVAIDIGKGAATVVGGIAVLWLAAVPVLFAVWLCVLILTGYVGLSTILAGLSFAVFAMVAMVADADQTRLIFAIAAALLLLFTHRANIARLLAGTESRFEKARLLHRWARRG